MCVILYCVGSGNGATHSLEDAWQPCFASKKDLTTLPLAGRGRDTDASYYPGSLAYSTLETNTMAWLDRKPMQCQDLETKNVSLKSKEQINARKQKTGRE